MPATPSQSGTETSSHGVTLLIVGGVILFVGLFVWLALGLGWLPGYPNPEEKSVPIYQPAGDSASLALYLHPPLSSIQAAGESQLLAFQFTNHSGADLAIRSLDVSPSECFRIAPHPEKSGGVAGVILKPGQSSLFWYRLSAHRDLHINCLAQFPLVFHYRWQTGPASSPLAEEESISTGPVEVTTRFRIICRRLVVLTSRVIPIILIPLLIAVGGWFLQEFQERRAAEQKKQEQKLEVWKTVLPGIIDAIRNHYVPMLSIISVMRAETSKQPPAAPDLDEVLAGALLLRNKLSNMVWHSGGFYFQDLRGEELCAVLFDTLMDRFYELAADKDAFRNAAEDLPADSTPLHVKNMLRAPSAAASPLQKMRRAVAATVAANPAALTRLNRYFDVILELLNYEANGPFYPWYEERARVDKSRLTTDQLGLDADTARAFDDYVKTLPSR